MTRHPQRSPLRLRWRMRELQAANGEVVPFTLNCWRATFQMPIQAGVQMALDGIDLDALFINAATGDSLTSLVVGGAYDSQGRCIYMNSDHTLIARGGGGGVFVIVEEFFDGDSDPNNS